MSTTASPDWASPLRDTMFAGWNSAQTEEFSVEPRDEFELNHVDMQVVYRHNGDVIYQVFPHQGDTHWPSLADARQFLAEVIEAHFGDTRRFSASYVPEVSSWGILAKGLKNIPTFNREFHVDAFVQLVDDAVDAL